MSADDFAHKFGKLSFEERMFCRCRKAHRVAGAVGGYNEAAADRRCHQPLCGHVPLLLERICNRGSLEKRVMADAWLIGYGATARAAFLAAFIGPGVGHAAAAALHLQMP